MTDRSLALVSFFFPPDGGAGTQRTARFASYLPEAGWQPTVVTREIPATRGRWDPHDASVAPDLAATVVRVPVTGTPSPWARRCRDPDLPLPWLDSVHNALSQRREGLAAAVFSMSPFCLSLVGRRLQRETGLKVIYDLRDPWALDGWRVYRNRRQWRRDLERMEVALRTADGVVANTADARQAMLDRFAGLDPERIAVVTNGYDDEALPTATDPDPEDGDDRFTVVHTGTLHSDNLYPGRGLRGLVRRFRRFRCETMDPSGRTALHLLRAVKLLDERGHPLGRRIRVVLVGVNDAATARSVAESGVADRVTLTGYLPHNESVHWLRRADALFLPLGALPPGRRSLIVPGKVYEYVASGRPILACLPDGDALDLVRRHTLAATAPPCDAAAIADALVELDGADRRGSFASEEFLARYHRRTLAASLGAFVDQVVASPPMARS